jgi:putative transposase
MNCPHCHSTNTHEYQKTMTLGYRIVRCRGCARTFNERAGTPFNDVQYPSDVVMLVLVWRLRYKLSLRDLVETFAVRGYGFSHETVRYWEGRFTPLLSARLKAKRRGQAGKSWYTDETYVKINGQCHYLYCAIDRDGNLVDTMLSPTRDLAAAKAFFKQAVETVDHKSERVTTDGHDSYPRATRSTLGRKVLHRTNRYLNNRIEQDHRAVKQRYYPMRGFGSLAGAARFCTAFDELRQYFRFSPTPSSVPHSPKNVKPFSSTGRSYAKPGRPPDRQEEGITPSPQFPLMSCVLKSDTTVHFAGAAGVWEAFGEACLARAVWV